MDTTDMFVYISMGSKDAHKNTVYTCFACLFP